MTGYQPQVGDRVRVVLEGRVEESGSAGFTVEPGYRIYNDEVQVVSVEKVTPPLPTTPGSVIQGRGTKYRYALRNDGRWAALWDGGVFDADQMSPSVEVIFDAGSVTS